MQPKDSENPFAGHGRPSEYMRARRPHLFSDTKQTSKPSLGKDFLEYILNNITSRKQEYDFEHFCRQMAEREICKNLIPQTGPTGGGDNKTDAETHPVAESVYETWFEGKANAPSGEKWAFAFSAKKDWRAKVKSDVQNISDTQRGYKRILFFTNQFVSAKKRSEIEQELQEVHGISVTILDRNWLVTKVFENDRIQIAIDALKISGVTPIESRVPGPNDAARIEELAQIEARIEDDTYYQGVEYQRIEDCLRVAILARGLEHPRAQVEGRFLRAQALADKNNSRQQKLRVAYNRAWTAHFWYDDIQELNNLYDSVEELAVGSGYISDIEMLSNLWQLLNVTTKKPNTAIDKTKFNARTERLRGELKRFMSYQDRASTSLQARSVQRS